MLALCHLLVFCSQAGSVVSLVLLFLEGGEVENHRDIKDVLQSL